MKELEELKAAFKDPQLVVGRSLFTIQVEHKIEDLENHLHRKQAQSNQQMKLT